MSKTATENILYKINKLLKIDDSNFASQALLDMMLDNATLIFDKFREAFEYDLSYDWFHKYFQEELADRKTNKQDFTPNSLSDLVSEMIVDNGIIYEPSAGTGGMIIKDWNRKRLKYLPWDFDNMKSFYIAEELSTRTIPFLIFNLAIRGINANVVNVNSLTRECKDIYQLENYSIGLSYSKIIKLPKNELAEKCFNVKFVN